MEMKAKTKKIVSILGAKYSKYVVVIVLFALWVGFWDKCSIVTHIAIKHNIVSLQREIALCLRKTAQDINYVQELRTKKKTLEQYARKRYLMRTPQEDVFLIVEK
jgi:cell division protein FtsB